MQDAMRSHARTGASVWSPAVCGTGARSQGAREQLPTPHMARSASRRAAGWDRRSCPPPQAAGSCDHLSVYYRMYKPCAVDG
jgi:hypothetical protein